VELITETHSIVRELCEKIDSGILSRKRRYNSFRLFRLFKILIRIIQNFELGNSGFQKHCSKLYANLIITDISSTKIFGFRYWITRFIRYVPVS
jgi:hypothetical protein